MTTKESDAAAQQLKAAAAAIDTAMRKTLADACSGPGPQAREPEQAVEEHVRNLDRLKALEGGVAEFATSLERVVKAARSSAPRTKRPSKEEPR